MTNIHQRPLRCKALEVRNNGKQEIKSWFSQLSLQMGSMAFVKEGVPAACIRQLYIWHYNQAPKSQHTAGPHLVILKPGSGLSEFVFFSLLQWTAGGNRLRVSKCAYELWFKTQLILPKSRGNRHLNPGALYAGRDLDPGVGSKAEILFSIILFWRNFPGQGVFVADTSLLT